ncbi:MAG TPA: ComF family protein [Rickettsiales bacterium]|nr:ComF family protein [Rickettsiales bacterium]
MGAVVDTLFPARCPACRETVGQHGSLCSACWQNIHFITDPMCCKCGVPFEYHIGEQAFCGPCMTRKPAYTQARAVFRYNEASRGQVLAMKYHDKTQLAPVFGAWLARIAQDYATKTHAIIPVPLHYTRLISRRYNQAALLAHAISTHTGLPVLPDTLLRARKTPPQSGLSRRQREDNMRGAFHIKKGKNSILKGKSVLLVDDVMTTGATLEACSRTLHDAGVRDVYVLTIARTVLAE